ncbi:MAG TPA: hypothetical protein ENN69_07450 [Spirochaetia bacterium]|nr:hypothetical protein [Spirochaetia bacterium]
MLTVDQLKAFLRTERDRLFKAKDYINSYYHQITSSLESLRDNLFPYAFSQRLTWKDDLNRQATQISVPHVIPKKLVGDPEFNSNTLIALINNIYAIQNAYLFNPARIEKPDITLVLKAHQFLLSFLNDQFSRSNIDGLQRQQRELAYSLKQSVEDRIQNSINPFFQRLEMILEDEYRLTLMDPIKLIVNSFALYKKDPTLYDELISRKARELGLKNDPELNLVIIADLEKPSSMIETEIKAKYQLTDDKRPANKPYRLKEIAGRYCSQTENVHALAAFLKDAEKALLHISIFKRIVLFLRNLFSGRGPEISHTDISFSYVAARGKIRREHTSLNDLIRNTEYYRDYLEKFKEELDLSTYTKSRNPRVTAEIEKFIETSFLSLNEIYEKSNGFREWLGRENNRTLLRRIPDRRQEEFNNLLLHVNRICIINNYNLHELDAG